MVDYINVIRRDLKVPTIIKDMLDKKTRLPYIYQSKIGYDTLTQNVILKEKINLLGTTKLDINIELKMKNSRIEYLESKKPI